MLPPEASDGGLRDAIVANWVDTANDQRQIEFLSESSLMLSDDGGFTATFYDFVDDDTVRLADGSGEMDLSLKGETLAITFKRLGTPPFPYDDGQTATFTKAPQPPAGESAPQ